jgi:hypothetical protein
MKDIKEIIYKEVSAKKLLLLLPTLTNPVTEGFTSLGNCYVNCYGALPKLLP